MREAIEPGLTRTKSSDAAEPRDAGTPGRRTQQEAADDSPWTKIAERGSRSAAGGDLDSLTHRMFGAMAGDREARPLPMGLRAQLEKSYRADLGAVSLVEDDLAAQLGVPAVTRGAVIHLARGAFDPDSDHGKHILAHEAAHVVQQGAVSDTSPTSSPQLHADVSYEHEAELAAHAALAGMPAQLTRGIAPAAFMGFDSWEHKLVGDSVAGAPYQVGHIELTHGDVVMLMGDYFDMRPDGLAGDNLRLLAAKPSKHPGHEVGTVDEVLCALDDCQQAPGSDPRFGPGGAWEKVTFSDDVKAAMKGRFKRLAMKNREHFANPTAGQEGGAPREAAGGSYRAMHEQAILDAYTAGTKSHDITDALVYEAGSEHFLTDAFSAGHVRTPRASLQSHWSKVYPDFGEQLARTLADLVGKELLASAATPDKVALVLFGPGAVYGAQKLLISKAADRVKAALGDAGPPSFGDVLSSILHDADNDHGLKVGNDLGWSWIAFGDDNMLAGKPSAEAGGRAHVDIIKLAVQLSTEDVQRAYQLGQRDVKAPHGRDAILAEVRHTVSQPARAGLKYAAEQLLPRLIDSSDGEQQWKADSFDQLLTQHVRTDMKGYTFDKAIAESARTGTLHNQMWTVAMAQDTAVTWQGYDLGIYPYQSFRDAVVEPLAKDPIAMFRKILASK
jgi:hypothetical protein